MASPTMPGRATICLGLTCVGLKRRFGRFRNSHAGYGKIDIVVDPARPYGVIPGHLERSEPSSSKPICSPMTKAAKQRSKTVQVVDITPTLRPPTRNDLAVGLGFRALLDDNSVAFGEPCCRTRGWLNLADLSERRGYSARLAAGNGPHFGAGRRRRVFAGESWPAPQVRSIWKDG